MHSISDKPSIKKAEITSASMKITSFTSYSAASLIFSPWRTTRTSNTKPSSILWQLSAVKSISPSGRYVFNGTEKPAMKNI